MFLFQEEKYFLTQVTADLDNLNFNINSTLHYEWLNEKVWILKLEGRGSYLHFDAERPI